ncbi:uncharacterized protein [Dermacentor albipictus]|uniref:uncharacterized protein n=1 Tax=Dermacentor albipictus TaxID=60249 RepID=UPI0031FBE03F
MYLEFEFKKLVRLSRSTCGALVEEFEESSYYPEDMLFIDVFIGIPGSAHDARVLRDSFVYDEAPANCEGKPANFMDDGNPDWAPSLQLGHGRYDHTTMQKEEMEMLEASLREDPNKVSFYTGLPNFVVLMAVFYLLEKFVKHTPQNSLVKFQEFLVFLMKLKLNLPFQDLAYPFNISESTVCRIFDKWLHVAFCRLKPLMSWPSRQAIRRTMPQAFFESFGEKVAVIVDCFEIKLEWPSSLQPRCQTWSQYKSSNTAKYLIGLCPQEVITFISNGWGGRTPDKHITQHCGILDHLSHGDVVLADRGFDIADSVGLYCAKLHIPAFTKGKRQLSAVDVVATRNIANVRIHVERVIGLVRNKYVIMKSVLSLEYATLKQGHQFTPLDKIVNVCCALTNFCQSVVPANPQPCS